MQGGSAQSVSHCWDCSYKCKPLTDSEVRTIIDFKSAFEGTTTCVRKLVDECDDCPNASYTKVVLASDEDPQNDIVHYTDVQRMGHNLICFNGNECMSCIEISSNDPVQLSSRSLQCHQQPQAHC